MSDLFVEEKPKLEIHFFVPGEIRGKDDPKSRVVKGTRKTDGQPYEFVHHYTDTKTRNYEAKVGSYAMIEKGKLGWAVTEKPVLITILAIFNIPKSYSKKLHASLPGAYCPSKPDYDNIEKCVGDGLRGVLFKDDKQICDAHCQKKYALPGQAEGLYVWVSECSA